MKEEIISFETALLAKEKGFNWELRDFDGKVKFNKYFDK